MTTNDSHAGPRPEGVSTRTVDSAADLALYEKPPARQFP